MYQCGCSNDDYPTMYDWLSVLLLIQQGDGGEEGAGVRFGSALQLPSGDDSSRSLARATLR